MLRSLALILLLLTFRLPSLGQESYAKVAELTFDSSSEAQIWENKSPQMNPFELFTAVHAHEYLGSDSWNDLVALLDSKFEKKGKSENFIRYIFEKSHQKLFKTYEQHATFNQMLSEGKFDCVSGSATLGMLLTRYGFSHDIIETDYHVFIMVDLDEAPIILESTLKIGGMITKSSEVDKYIQAYLPEEKGNYLNLNQRIGSPDVLESEKTIFRKVNLYQLAGLQYYNDAIMHFNQQAYRVAASQLEKAHQLYQSERIEGLKDLAVDQAYKSIGVDLKK